MTAPILTSRIETYSTGEGDLRKFFVLIHGEGRGKFIVRKSNLQEEQIKRYVVESVAGAARRFKSFINAVPKNVDNLFEIGALTLSYYEGETLIEFSDLVDFKDNPEELARLAQMAESGLGLLAREFSVIEDATLIESKKFFSPWVLSILSAILLSLFSLLYGSKIIPLNWIFISLICFVAQIPICLIFRSLSKEFLKIGKVFFLAFLVINSICLMTLNGFLSLHFARENVRQEEGIIEAFFSGHRLGHLMRVRLISKRYTSFLVPVSLVQTKPEVLPHAAMFVIREGFFESEYLDSISLK
jgi:hypothetical protein